MIKKTFLIGLFIFAFMTQLQAAIAIEGQESTKPNSEPNSAENSGPRADKAAAEESKAKRVLFPLLFYTPETSLGLGLINIEKLKSHSEGKTDQILSNVALTLKGQTFINVAPKFYRDNNQGDVSGAFSYTYFPSKYYGQPGTKVTSSDGESFTENNMALNFSLSQSLRDNFFVRGGLIYEQKKVSHVDLGTKLSALLISTTDSVEAYGGTLGFEWDERNFPQSPTNGAWYQFKYTYLNLRDINSIYAIPVFNKYEFDLRQYWSLTSNSVFAIQMQLSDLPGSQFVPFQYLNSIGGGSKMRGVTAGKYRDRTLGLGQAEYRYQFYEKWFAHGFIAGARIADRTDHLNEASPIYSAGGGVQYLLDKESRTKLRIDLGFSDGQSGFYFLIGEAF